MKAKFALDNPKQVECTMKLTMTLSEWEQLQKQLENKLPAASLSQAIKQLLEQANASILSTTETPVV